MNFGLWATESELSTSLKEKVNKLEISLLKKKKLLEDYEGDISKKNEKYHQHVRVNKKLSVLLDDYRKELSDEKVALSSQIKEVKKKIIKITMLDNNKKVIEKRVLSRILEKKLENDLIQLEGLNSKIGSLELKISSLSKRIKMFNAESIKISSKLRKINLEKEKVQKSKREVFMAKDILEDEYLEMKANQEFEKIKNESENTFISKTYLSNPIDEFVSAEKKHKGFEFKVSINSELKAIDDGKVVHSDFLSNFGRIIIIKHKNNLRSVYLGDYESNISPETLVKKSQILGNILPGKESKIYFELRKKEKPLELANYYRLNSVI